MQIELIQFKVYFKTNLRELGKCDQWYDLLASQMWPHRFRFGRSMSCRSWRSAPGRMRLEKEDGVLAGDRNRVGDWIVRSCAMTFIRTSLVRLTLVKPENTHLLCKAKYHCMADLLFDWFGFAKLVNRYLIQHKQGSWIVTSQESVLWSNPIFL